MKYLPLYPPVLLVTAFFTLILAVIFSWSSESAGFVSCNLMFASFACFSDLNILLFTSGNRILSFLLLYFSNPLIILKENTSTDVSSTDVHQKYSAVRRIFNSLLGVSSGDETLRLLLDILLK